MSGPTVAAAKVILKRRYNSYAGVLDTGPDFTPQLQMVLAEYQGRRNVQGGWKPVLRQDGVLDYNTQDSLGMIPHTAPAKKVVLFTVQGAGVDMYTGYQADTARALADIAEWQPIGNYPAAAFPMQDSVNQGIAELRLQIRRWAQLHPGIKMILIGYSEGSLVTGSVWKNDIVNPNGILHDLYLAGFFIAGVTWGFPMREQGKANGNVYAGQPIPDGQGIVDDRMTNTPDFWYDFAHGANGPQGRDIYTDEGTGDTGLIESAIWHIVASVDFFSQGAIVPLLITELQKPLAVILPAFEAIIQAGMFFIVNGLTPHTNYDIQPAINLLRGIISAL